MVAELDGAAGSWSRKLMTAGTYCTPCRGGAWLSRSGNA
jgi:hypothetical protein